MILDMLDLKFIRDNIDAVRENVKNRHVTADPDLVVELYDQRNQLLKELEALRASRNANADRMKGKLSAEERAPLIEEGKRLKEGIARAGEAPRGDREEPHRRGAEDPQHVAPVGARRRRGDGQPQLRTWGTPPSFSFAARDHVQLGQSLDLIDFETGAKVAGQKFYYLKNQAVILELALVRYALDALMREGLHADDDPGHGPGGDRGGPRLQSARAREQHLPRGGHGPVPDRHRGVHPRRLPCRQGLRRSSSFP